MTPTQQTPTWPRYFRDSCGSEEILVTALAHDHVIKRFVDSGIEFKSLLSAADCLEIFPELTPTEAEAMIEGRK